MLCSILMIFISDVALKYGIVTHASELSQNLLNMNEIFWAVWIYSALEGNTEYWIGWRVLYLVNKITVR